MTLVEIEANAAAQRVKQLKANEQAAKERAKQLATQAAVSAERLNMQTARQKLSQLQRSSTPSTIKPH